MLKLKLVTLLFILFSLLNQASASIITSCPASENIKTIKIKQSINAAYTANVNGVIYEGFDMLTDPTKLSLRSVNIKKLNANNAARSKITCIYEALGFRLLMIAGGSLSDQQLYNANFLSTSGTVCSPNNQPENCQIEARTTELKN